MRICLTIVVAILLASWSRIDGAAAQCDPAVCANPSGSVKAAKAAKAKHHRRTQKAKPRTAQKAKAGVEYLRY